jgi:hypothetical protein
MNRAMRIRLGAAAMVILAAAAGCGGSVSELARSAPSPGTPVAEPAGQPGQAQFEAPADAPAPPPVAGLSAPSKSSRSSDAREGARPEAVAPREPTARPGLGTEWGETRTSRISTVPFVRSDTTTPFAMAGVFYNDEQGARAMANASGFRRTSGGPIPAAGGAVTVGLRDERGGFLSGFVAGGKSFVVGEAGQRYTIVVRNNTDLRFEVVLSVDGLDVLDGKNASFAKRGYIVDPRGELEVDGFRQSTETVAAFRFGSVRNSYAAQKHGETRNVGVIGLALFHERGTNPFPWTNGEIQRRQDANPFPGQFATPP